MQILVCTICFWTQSSLASDAHLQCVNAHGHAVQSPFIEAHTLEQIQKNLTGNRPLLAMIRGSKKDPQMESGLVAVIRKMPASVQSQFAEITGYDIVGGQFQLLRELKNVDRDWTGLFKKQALEAIQNLQAEASRKGENLGTKGVSSYRVQAVTLKQYTLQVSWFMRYVADHIWKVNFMTILPQLNDSAGLSNLMNSREAVLYFLFVTKGMVDPDSHNILTYQGESTAGRVADIYNDYNQNKKNVKKVTPEDILHAYQEFPRMALRFQKRLFEIQNAREQKSLQSQEHSDTSAEVRGSSLRELIELLSPQDAVVISQNLIDLIQTVDSSEKQIQSIQEALRSEKPQLRLLEMAYALKQHEDLTQKEIQAAVYSGLNEITSPGLVEQSASEELPTPETVAKVAPDSLPVVETLARDSKSRIAKMKQDLQSPNLEFHLLIHNEKEFFDILKPGTGRFESVEKDIEVLQQKFARVFSYFSGNSQVLPGDGHFSITNRRIFDLKYGSYRFLVTKSRSSEDLIVLVVFNKNDGGNVKKEMRFYDLAGDRLTRGGY